MILEDGYGFCGGLDAVEDVVCCAVITWSFGLRCSGDAGHEHQPVPEDPGPGTPQGHL